MNNYTVFKIFRWLRHSNYCAELHRCQQTLTMHLLTRASYKILVKTTGFILIRDGATFWKTVSRHTTSVVLSFVLTAGRYTVSTCSGENILNSCILRSVLSRRVASPRLRLSSSLRTTHAAHPSHANHYNDSTYGSTKTNILSHNLLHSLIQ